MTHKETPAGGDVSVDTSFTQSFDACAWARGFIEHVKAHPGIPTDEGTMVGWFANALMRGYDEHARRSAPQVGDDWRPSEVLFAFAGWLTSRDEPIVMSATDNAAPAAEAVAEFCRMHHLSEPRGGWHLVGRTTSRVS